MATISEQRNRRGELIGWQAKIRRRGWPVRSKVCGTRKAAEDWATHTEAEMIKGTYVDRRPADRTTLHAVIQDYIDQIAPTHKGGSSEVARLKRFTRTEPKLCQYAMALLTPELFEKWRDRRLKEVAPGTVKREFNLLNTVIESARRRLKMIENPLTDVDRPRVDDERDVRLSPRQWRRLLEECRKERTRAGPRKEDASGKRIRPPNPWLAPAVELARETGARRAELLGWLWKDTDLKHRVAVFRDVKNSRDPKTRIDRQIGLSPRAIAILKKLPRSTDGRVIPLTTESLKQSFERARARAGLPHFRLHDARHELASSLTEAGWSPVEVMAQGGWRDPKSMKRYTNLSGKHLAARFRTKLTSKTG